MQRTPDEEGIHASLMNKVRPLLQENFETLAEEQAIQESVESLMEATYDAITVGVSPDEILSYIRQLEVEGPAAGGPSRAHRQITDSEQEPRSETEMDACGDTIVDWIAT